MSMIDDIDVQVKRVQTALSKVASHSALISSFKDSLETIPETTQSGLPSQEAAALRALICTAEGVLPAIVAAAFTEAVTLSDLAEVVIKQIKVKIESADIDVFTKDGKVVVQHSTKTELDHAGITRALLDAMDYKGLMAAASYTQAALEKITGGAQLVKDHSKVVLGSVSIKSSKLSKDDQVEILPLLSEATPFITRPSKAAIIPLKVVPIKSATEEGAKEQSTPGSDAV
jgi:roadblock/LC7 domain-containing protein